jgi:F420-dependent oxidoreductase-like protein
MIDIAMMIEAQDGLNWPRWQGMVQAVEELGFAGLYRSDHFTNSRLPVKDSLEQWVSFTWLASHTRRIEFGSLVSPVSFRDPVFTARMALQVDDLSGGRLRLGLGAGWQEHEHNMFGYDLLPVARRFQRFEEGLQVITSLMRSDQPVDFEGQFYQLRQALFMPRPLRPGGPPIVIGGNGVKRTLPLVARYADEWNAVDVPAERFHALNAHLEQLLPAAGRSSEQVRRSLMTSLVFGRDERQLQDKLGSRDRQALGERGVVIGTPGQVREQIAALEQAGVQRVMLRWSDLEDLDGLREFAQAVY